ncbi:TnsA-like heteromeric transposase endonuclease subunit [Streptomyces cellulosae]
MAVRSSGKGRGRDRVPMVSVRYVDGSTCDIPFARLRAADFAESQPWRHVRSVHGMLHHSGEYASATTGGQVVYESRLELARLLLADFDPSVVGIFAQPCRVVAHVDGRVRGHVPDFLLMMRSGTVRVVNVKPAERAGSEDRRGAGLAGAAGRAARLGVRGLDWHGSGAPGERAVPGGLPASRHRARREDRAGLA